MRIQYLDAELMEKMCHRLAMAVFDTDEDPISPFRDHAIALLESALNLPRATFDGRDLYSSLVDKAVILYYTLNKNHPFKNGNKRISTAALLVFLHMNDHWLDAGKEEMTQKALYVADSKPLEREKVLQSIKSWIQAHLTVSNKQTLF